MWRRLQRTRRDRVVARALAGATGPFAGATAPFAFTAAPFAVATAALSVAAACAATTTATTTAPKCGIVANPVHGIRRCRSV